jgi:hypothetical protein
MGCSGMAHALHELSCFKCINRSLLNFSEGHDILQTLDDFQFSCVFVSGHDRAMGTLMNLSQLWQATMRQYNASVIAVCSPCNISRRNLPFASSISSATMPGARVVGSSCRHHGSPAIASQGGGSAKELNKSKQ